MSLDIPDVLGSSTLIQAPTAQAPTPQNIVVQTYSEEDDEEFTSATLENYQSP